MHVQRVKGAELTGGSAQVELVVQAWHEGALSLGLPHSSSSRGTNNSAIATRPAPAPRVVHCIMLLLLLLPNNRAVLLEIAAAVAR